MIKIQIIVQNFLEKKNDEHRKVVVGEIERSYQWNYVTQSHEGRKIQIKKVFYLIFYCLSFLSHYL